MGEIRWRPWRRAPCFIRCFYDQNCHSCRRVRSKVIVSFLTPSEGWCERTLYCPRELCVYAHRKWYTTGSEFEPVSVDWRVIHHHCLICCLGTSRLLDGTLHQQAVDNGESRAVWLLQWRHYEERVRGINRPRLADRFVNGHAAICPLIPFYFDVRRCR